MLNHYRSVNANLRFGRHSNKTKLKSPSRSRNSVNRRLWKERYIKRKRFWNLRSKTKNHRQYTTRILNFVVLEFINSKRSKTALAKPWEMPRSYILLLLCLLMAGVEPNPGPTVKEILTALSEAKKQPPDWKQLALNYDLDVQESAAAYASVCAHFIHNLVNYLYAKKFAAEGHIAVDLENTKGMIVKRGVVYDWSTVDALTPDLIVLRGANKLTFYDIKTQKTDVRRDYGEVIAKYNCLGARVEYKSQIENDPVEFERTEIKVFIRNDYESITKFARENNLDKALRKGLTSAIGLNESPETCLTRLLSWSILYSAINNLDDLKELEDATNEKFISWEKILMEDVMGLTPDELTNLQDQVVAEEDSMVMHNYGTVKDYINTCRRRWPMEWHYYTEVDAYFKKLYYETAVNIEEPAHEQVIMPILIRKNNRWDDIDMHGWVFEKRWGKGHGHFDKIITKIFKNCAQADSFDSLDLTEEERGDIGLGVFRDLNKIRTGALSVKQAEDYEIFLQEFSPLASDSYLDTSLESNIIDSEFLKMYKGIPRMKPSLWAEQLFVLTHTANMVTESNAKAGGYAILAYDNWGIIQFCKSKHNPHNLACFQILDRNIAEHAAELMLVGGLFKTTFQFAHTNGLILLITLPHRVPDGSLRIWMDTPGVIAPAMSYAEMQPFNDKLFDSLCHFWWLIFTMHAPQSDVNADFGGLIKIITSEYCNVEGLFKDKILDCGHCYTTTAGNWILHRFVRHYKEMTVSAISQLYETAKNTPKEFDLDRCPPTIFIKFFLSIKDCKIPLGLHNVLGRISRQGTGATYTIQKRFQLIMDDYEKLLIKNKKAVESRPELFIWEDEHCKLRMPKTLLEVKKLDRWIATKNPNGDFTDALPGFILAASMNGRHAIKHTLDTKLFHIVRKSNIQDRIVSDASPKTTINPYTCKKMICAEYVVDQQSLMADPITRMDMLNKLPYSNHILSYPFPKAEKGKAPRSIESPNREAHYHVAFLNRLMNASSSSANTAQYKESNSRIYQQMTHKVFAAQYKYIRDSDKAFAQSAVDCKKYSPSMTPLQYLKTANVYWTLRKMGFPKFAAMMSFYDLKGQTMKIYLQNCPIAIQDPLIARLTLEVVIERNLPDGRYIWLLDGKARSASFFQGYLRKKHKTFAEIYMLGAIHLVVDESKNSFYVDRHYIDLWAKLSNGFYTGIGKFNGYDQGQNTGANCQNLDYGLELLVPILAGNAPKKFVHQGIQFAGIPNPDVYSDNIHKAKVKFFVSGGQFMAHNQYSDDMRYFHGATSQLECIRQLEFLLNMIKVFGHMSHISKTMISPFLCEMIGVNSMDDKIFPDHVSEMKNVATKLTEKTSKLDTSDVISAGFKSALVEGCPMKMLLYLRLLAHNPRDQRYVKEKLVYAETNLPAALPQMVSKMSYAAKWDRCLQINHRYRKAIDLVITAERMTADHLLPLTMNNDMLAAFNNQHDDMIVRFVIAKYKLAADVREIYLESKDENPYAKYSPFTHSNAFFPTILQTYTVNKTVRTKIKRITHVALQIVKADVTAAHLLTLFEKLPKFIQSMLLIYKPKGIINNFSYYLDCLKLSSGNIDVKELDMFAKAKMIKKNKGKAIFLYPKEMITIRELWLHALTYSDISIIRNVEKGYRDLHDVERRDIRVDEFLMIERICRVADSLAEDQLDTFKALMSLLSNTTTFNASAGSDFLAAYKDMHIDMRPTTDVYAIRDSKIRFEISNQSASNLAGLAVVDVLKPDEADELLYHLGMRIEKDTSVLSRYLTTFFSLTNECLHNSPNVASFVFNLVHDSMRSPIKKWTVKAGVDIAALSPLTVWFFMNPTPYDILQPAKEVQINYVKSTSENYSYLRDCFCWTIIGLDNLGALTLPNLHARLSENIEFRKKLREITEPDPSHTMEYELMVVMMKDDYEVKLRILLTKGVQLIWQSPHHHLEGHVLKGAKYNTYVRIGHFHQIIRISGILIEIKLTTEYTGIMMESQNHCLTRDVLSALMAYLKTESVLKQREGNNYFFKKGFSMKNSTNCDALSSKPAQVKYIDSCYSVLSLPLLSYDDCVIYADVKGAWSPYKTGIGQTYFVYGTIDLVIGRITDYINIRFKPSTSQLIVQQANTRFVAPLVTNTINLREVDKITQLECDYPTLQKEIVFNSIRHNKLITKYQINTAVETSISLQRMPGILSFWFDDLLMSTYNLQNKILHLANSLGIHLTEITVKALDKKRSSIRSFLFYVRALANVCHTNDRAKEHRRRNIIGDIKILSGKTSGSMLKYYKNTQDNLELALAYARMPLVKEDDREMETMVRENLQKSFKQVSKGFTSIPGAQYVLTNRKLVLRYTHLMLSVFPASHSHTTISIQRQWQLSFFDNVGLAYKQWLDFCTFDTWEPPPEVRIPTLTAHVRRKHILSKLLDMKLGHIYQIFSLDEFPTDIQEFHLTRTLASFIPLDYATLGIHLNVLKLAEEGVVIRFQAIKAILAGAIYIFDTEWMYRDEIEDDITDSEPELAHQYIDSDVTSEEEVIKLEEETRIHRSTLEEIIIQRLVLDVAGGLKIHNIWGFDDIMLRDAMALCSLRRINTFYFGKTIRTLESLQYKKPDIVEIMCLIPWGGLPKTTEGILEDSEYEEVFTGAWKYLVSAIDIKNYLHELNRLERNFLRVLDPSKLIFIQHLALLTTCQHNIPATRCQKISLMDHGMYASYLTLAGDNKMIDCLTSVDRQLVKYMLARRAPSTDLLTMIREYRFDLWMLMSAEHELFDTLKIRWDEIFDQNTSAMGKLQDEFNVTQETIEIMTKTLRTDWPSIPLYIYVNITAWMHAAQDPNLLYHLLAGRLLYKNDVGEYTEYVSLLDDDVKKVVCAFCQTRSCPTYTQLTQIIVKAQHKLFQWQTQPSAHLVKARTPMQLTHYLERIMQESHQDTDINLITEDQFTNLDELIEDSMENISAFIELIESNPSINAMKVYMSGVRKVKMGVNKQQKAVSYWSVKEYIMALEQLLFTEDVGVRLNMDEVFQIFDMIEFEDMDTHLLYLKKVNIVWDKILTDVEKKLNDILIRIT